MGRAADLDKRMLRRGFLAVRSRLTPYDLRESAGALALRAMELPELAHARTVAAYISMGSEPGTLALLDALHTRGVRVLLPVLLADNDLDWGAYAGGLCGACPTRRQDGSTGAGGRAARPPRPSRRPTPSCCPALPWTGAECVWGAAAAGLRRPGPPGARGGRSRTGGAAVRRGGRGARPGGTSRPSRTRGGDAFGGASLRLTGPGGRKGPPRVRGGPFHLSP